MWDHGDFVASRIGFGKGSSSFWPPSMMAGLNWADAQNLVLAITALAILVSIGVYLAGQIRAKAIQKEPTANELLTKFRELNSQGVVSDEEFRTIKTTLTDRLQTELKGKDETG
jgi:uncharacterized membrane protein